ncbi:FAD-binding oxidoreductase [Ensifer sp. ENS10]|nr:FAD-binding oxidoreductase [Ensifer sp. ENS10]
MRACLARLKRALPSQRNIQIVERWAGGIDVLPDGIPVLDAPTTPSGLMIATGFCGHGFALGPIVGKILADWLTTGQPGSTCMTSACRATPNATSNHRIRFSEK